MFVRIKKSPPYEYLQVVENRREGKRVVQRVVATLGRMDRLRENGAIESVMSGLSRYAERAIALREGGDGVESEVVRIGAGKIWERIWQGVGIGEVVGEKAGKGRHEFSLERAVYLTVVHRLMSCGSDRSAHAWKRDYELKGAGEIELHQAYRAMGWLGEETGEEGECGKRYRKDEIEEELFSRRRDLFSEGQMVFFDTTTLYFEGAGGEEIGRRGWSKDHRPDLPQMVVGVVLDEQGYPICCQMWPGNMTDVKTLVPVAKRLKNRFLVERVCIVADRGMLSKQTIAELEGCGLKLEYILGARMRNQKEVSGEVLGDCSSYQEVRGSRTASKDPAPLKVKEVKVDSRRYVVCYNEEEARRDAKVREAIIEQLREKLKAGAKKLIGNKGYRKYLRTMTSGSFEIDNDAIATDARYDGVYVLRTNTKLSTPDVALKYKMLWTIERLFRDTKSLLETRPIFHKCDDTIRGHVFCTFLALLLRKELDRLLAKKSLSFEWQQIKQDLNALYETTITSNGKTFLLRSAVLGCAGKVFQAVGVQIPPTIRQLD